MFAASAVAAVLTVPGTAVTGTCAVMLLATVLHLGTTAAMTHRLEVSEAATSDNRSAVENDQRYGRPHDGRPEMAADKPS